MSVGSCDVADATEATTRAVTEAIASRAAALVLVFASPRYDPRAVAAAAAAAAGDAVVAGASTAGEIAHGVSSRGRVVAVAIGGDGVVARAAVAATSQGFREAGERVAHALDGIDSPHRALILMDDGLTGQHGAMVRGAYGVAGAGVALVGGSAGDNLTYAGTWQMCGGSAYQQAVVGVAVGSPGPLAVGFGHGWRRLGEEMVVTSADERRILTIDDQPALDYYLDKVGAPDEAYRDESVWQSVAVTRPLGIPRPWGDDVRALLEADFEERALMCSDVPQGSLVCFMESDVDSTLAGTRQSLEYAIAGLDGAPLVGVIAFDCVARQMILGADGLAQEMAIIAGVAGDAPVGGFYTYGEVARMRGSRGVHSATLVTLAVG